MNSIEIELQDCPRSYSAVNVFEDVKVRIALGLGRGQPVASVELKTYGLSVIGGRHFYTDITGAQKPKTDGLSAEEWDLDKVEQFTLNYAAVEIMQSSSKFKMLLTGLIAAGRRKGQDEIREELRGYANNFIRLMGGN